MSIERSCVDCKKIARGIAGALHEVDLHALVPEDKVRFDDFVGLKELVDSQVVEMVDELNTLSCRCPKRCGSKQLIGHLRKYRKRGRGSAALI